MDTSSYGKMFPKSRESNSSCNTFVDGTLTDDAPMPLMRQPSRSRSYCCNRFSSHALATSTTTVVMMLAVYLLLPHGCLAIVAETNETSTILTKPPGAFVVTASQDVDNEISETLEEKPTIIEKTNFEESSLTENLEDTIRNSVKSEIEMEQNVGSPALINAYNVLPETEKIVLVEYSGGTTNQPKSEQQKEQSVESTFAVQCEDSSTVCERTNVLEVSSTPVTIENILATTVVPEIDTLVTTTVEPLLEETTSLPDSNIDQFPSETQREGRTLEVVQNPLDENQTTVEVVSQTSSNEEENLKTKEHDVENEVSVSANEINLGITEQQSQIEEVEIQNEANDLAVKPLTVSKTQDELIEESVDVSEHQEIHNEPQKGENDSIKPIKEEKDTENTNEPRNTMVASLGNEIQIPISISEPNSQESKRIDNEIASQSSEDDQTSVQVISHNEADSTNPLNTERPVETEINPFPQSNSVVSVSSNESNEISTTPTSIENNSDESTSNENISGASSKEVNFGDQESVKHTTTSSEPTIVKNSELVPENETLTIVFEEPLGATETTVPVVDDYIKTIIEMEDPVLHQSFTGHTTIRPEQPIHNVIKKQGVEPVDIESPIDTSDSESESTTIVPMLNAPIDIFTIDEAEIEKTLQQNTEHQQIVTEENIAADVTTHEELNQTANASDESIAVDITEVSVVFPGKGDDDAGLNGKGSRSINALDHTPNHKASINFDVYPAGQTFNENLAEELPNGIGKALPTHRLSEQSSNRSALIIALCSGTALLFIAISVAIFMVSFQRQHGTLDIEMQEKRDNIHDDDAETCLKLLDIELPNTSLALQTDAEAEIEECL